MKKFLYIAAAAIAALSACTKAGIEAPESETAPVFTATIESDAETKTQLATGSTASKKKVEWLNTDEVFIYSAAADQTKVAVGTYTVTPGANAATASLTPGTLAVDNQGSALKYTIAVYPSSISVIMKYMWPDDIVIIDNGLSLNYSTYIELPASQSYGGTDISNIAPMMAINTVGSTRLQFKNLTSLLAITVSAEDFTSVNNIKVSSDQILNGMLVLNPLTGEFSLEDTFRYTDDNRTVTLRCNVSGSNSTINPGGTKTFYVSIPDNTYGYLQIGVTDGITTKYMKTTAASITVERNKIYPIDFEENYTPSSGNTGITGTRGTTKATINGNEVDVPWVQLWQNGPRWAVYNIGATSPAQVGSYFTFGASEAYTASNANTYSSLSDIQGTIYDTAKNLWGSNWQMPTYQDLFYLYYNKTYTDGGVWKTAAQSGYGVAGLLVTGKGDYSSNSVFFPASGFYSGSNLSETDISYYWSSEGGMALRASASASDPYMSSCSKATGRAVRAIVVE